MTSDSVHSSGSTGPKRRYLTILFSDLSNSTKLAAAMEAEDFSLLLDALRSAYEDVIPKHGGTLVQIQGDGLLAIFGHPEAREDDGRRATEAAIELHTRVRAIAPNPNSPALTPLTLHTGIHSGLALLNQGDAVTGRFQLLGNAANIAARISDEARSDEILVSAETLGPDHRFFNSEGLRRLTLEGVPQPVSVLRIFSRSPSKTRLRARVRQGLVSFVGRPDELRTLEAAFQESMLGKPVLLRLVGATGIGKTRLVEHFLEHVAKGQCRAHQGYCESHLGAEPLQPFLQMMRLLCGIGYGISADVATESLRRTLLQIDDQLLAHFSAISRALSLAPVADDSPRRRTPETTIGALRDVFDALAGAQPLLLHIDDWQWADDASRHALDAIMDLDKPIFVLVATRELAAREVMMRNVQTLELAPLSPEETGNAIRWLIPSIDPFIAGEIERASGGNPLFLEELCHSALAPGNETRAGLRHGGTAWLNTLIESRFTRLSTAESTIVRIAAVIGNVIPVWLLERLSGIAPGHPLIKALADQDVIFPGETPGTLRFKHGIARDVIYNAIGLHQRRSLHARIAELVRQQSAADNTDDHHELLAYHYAAAGKAAEAAQYAELAGNKAIAASSLDRAQAQYRAALAALDQIPPDAPAMQRWSQIAQRLGMACVFDPSRDSLGLLHRAVSIANTQREPVLIARAEYWLGYVLYALGDSHEAIEHFELALASATLINDAAFIAELHATLGQSNCAACNYDKALSLLAIAIDFKRQHRKERPAMVGLAYSLACKASVLGDRGMFDQAHDCFDEALQLVRGTGHEVEGSILCWCSGVFLWQGRWDDARQAAAKAGVIAERVKSLYVYAMSMSLGAYAQWCASRDPECLKTLSTATSWLDNLDRELFISLNHGWLADAYSISAQWGETRRHAARALMRSRHHDRIGEAMAYRALARAAAAGHARHSVQYYLARALASAEARGSPHERAVTLLCSAEIDVERRLPGPAMASLAEAEIAFASMQMSAHAIAAADLRRGL